MAHPAPDLARLLDDLRRTRALVTPQELAHRLPPMAPTGLPPLDRLLGGGLPEGRVVELGEGKGAFASAVALQILARFTSEGRPAALVDRADAFDPRCAAEAGVDLERTLWCRPSSSREAIRAADALLASGAFSLVILDLARWPARWPAGGPRMPSGRRREPPISQGAWLRLARDAEAARASLLVVGDAVAAGVSAASLRLLRSRACFLGQGPGRTFEGLEITVGLERNRLGLPPGEAVLALRSPSHFPWAVREPGPGQARSDAWAPSPEAWRWSLQMDASQIDAPSAQSERSIGVPPSVRRVDAPSPRDGARDGRVASGSKGRASWA